MKRFMVALSRNSRFLSLVVLLVIVLVSFVVGYAWYLGNTGSTSGNGRKIQIQGITADSLGKLVVYVVNDGDAPVELDPSSCVRVNDNLVSCVLDNSVLSTGQVAKLTANYLVTSTGSVNVKLTTRDGVTAETTQVLQASLTNSTITVTSDPLGSTFVRVDGIEVATPAVFSWSVGSSHTLEAVAAVGNESIRYSFLGWSDNGPQSHTFVVTTAKETVTANY